MGGELAVDVGMAAVSLLAAFVAGTRIGAMRAAWAAVGASFGDVGDEIDRGVGPEKGRRVPTVHDLRVGEVARLQVDGYRCVAVLRRVDVTRGPIWADASCVADSPLRLKGHPKIVIRPEFDVIGR